jgi:outer membrane protein assembly factor BamB
MFRRFSFFLSIAGMVLLSYVSGVAVAFYQLPSSEWLTNAFVGAHLWRTSEAGLPGPLNPTSQSVTPCHVDRLEKTFDGYTFYACTNLGTQAFLVNMRHEVVHRWTIKYGDIWPNPTHVPSQEPAACFFGSYLYPNGDLLVTFHGACLPTGCGLAKIDARSNLLWAYPVAAHHDVDVAEDGTIYALMHEYTCEIPPGLERIATPTLVDYVLTLSPDGKQVREPISVLEAFRKSPYAAFLASLEKPAETYVPQSGSTAPKVNHRFYGFDALHTNCVRILTRDLAAKFPQFKAGHVLISVRNLHVIAMLDPDQGRIVWAARGPWLAQHDPQFIDNGHLLIFDNLGSPTGSRVLEYDPQDQSLPWSFLGTGAERFYTSERGMSQRLPNGNTFIVSSEAGKMYEVTPDNEVVWSHLLNAYITTGRRYSAEQLTFLAGSQGIRP